MAPVKLKDPRQAAALLHFATRFAQKLPVELDVNVPESQPRTPDELSFFEGLHQVSSSTSQDLLSDVVPWQGHI